LLPSFGAHEQYAMMLTPKSSPGPLSSSPPPIAPGEALTHQCADEDDHWHECQESTVARSLNFGVFETPDSLPRYVSEDAEMDSARRVSHTEPAISPPCSLPMTPLNGSRAASPVGAGPSRLVRRWSRVSGYRTPGTTDGFVRCWQQQNAANSSEASSGRASRISLAPPVDTVAQREQAFDQTKSMIESCITDLRLRDGNLEQQQQDVWRKLQSSLTRAERLMRQVEPDRLLGALEHKVVVFKFVLGVHILKKKYRRQTSAALKTLLRSDAWRKTYIEDKELQMMLHNPEAEDLRGFFPVLLPLLPPLQLHKEEEAPSPLPIFSQPLSSRPGPVTSPTRKAAVDADVKAMRERRARRTTRRPDEPIGDTLRFCRDQVEALDFAAEGEADEVQVAFETFHRAVRQAFGKTSVTDFAKGCPLPNQTAELADFEPKTEMISFLKDVWAKRKLLRSRVSYVLARLYSLDAWKEILDAMPEVQELLQAESPMGPSPRATEYSPKSEPEPEASSTSRIAEAAEEPPQKYEAKIQHIFTDVSSGLEESQDQLHDRVRREAPWYLRVCFWLLGVPRALRYCKCLVPPRIHQEVSGTPKSANGSRARM